MFFGRHLDSLSPVERKFTEAQQQNPNIHDVHADCQAWFAMPGRIEAWWNAGVNE